MLRSVLHRTARLVALLVSFMAAYLYATAKGSGEQRPFVLYVVAEGGKPVVANVLVNRLVEGRHR